MSSVFFAAEAIAVRSLGHLRAEHRVVLGERVVALDLEVGLAVPGDAVEEDRLLDRRDERVADAAEHGVVGPDRSGRTSRPRPAAACSGRGGARA